MIYIKQLFRCLYFCSLLWSGLILSGCQSTQDQTAPLQSQQAISSLSNNLSSTLAALPDRTITTLSIGNQQLSVEVVNQPQSIVQGLSGRDSIGADGMLFVMPKRDKPTFWMIDMNFDLDLVWIDSNTIVDISYDVPKPEPGTSPADLPRYVPKHPVTLVLELPAGKAEELNMQVGQTISVQLDSVISK